MSTEHTNADNGTEPSHHSDERELEEWIEQPTRDAPFQPRAAWKHAQTGQWVTVEQNRRPTQMHDPMTSSDDVGYSARVYHEDGTGGRHLSHELGNKVDAYEAALEFMAAYPDGDYNIPDRGTWDSQVAEW